MIASLAILSGCGHNGGTGHNHGHDHETHEAHGKEAHNHGKDVIEFSQARAEAAGRKTETVKPGKFNAALTDQLTKQLVLAGADSHEPELFHFYNGHISVSQPFRQ